MKKNRSGKPAVSPTAADAFAGELSPELCHLLALLTVFAVGLVSYANTFTVPFVLDDVTSILANPLVKLFSFKLKTRILGDLTFAFNYRLNGLNPAGYHVANFSLHLLNSLFVYQLVQLIFRTPVFQNINSEKSGLRLLLPQLFGFGAALIFVSHPLQTQAVTYLAQRVAVQAASCYLGALLCYAASRLSPQRSAAVALLVLSLVLAIAGVLTKENAITIPLTILLFELTFFWGGLKGRLLTLVWYLLPLIVVPILVMGKIGFSSDLLGEVSRLTAEGGAPSRITYLLTQFPVIVSYLRLFVLPINQNLDHDVPLRTSFADPVVLGAFLVLSLLAAAGWRFWLQSRLPGDRDASWKALAGFGVGWFFITLSVESSLIPIRDVMFEHRLYLPSIGLVLLSVLVVRYCVIRWNRADGDRTVSVCLIVFTVLGLVLGVATYRRNSVWQSEISLWQDVVSKSPGKSRAHGSLGHALQRAGFPDNAVRSYLQAVKLAPGDYIAHNNLGTIYLGQERPVEALEQFQEALQSKVASGTTRYNMGLALAKLERFTEAEAAYREAIKSGGANDQVLNNLGIVLYRQGRPREAMTSFREAVKSNPQNVEAAGNLAALEKALSASRAR